MLPVPCNKARSANEAVRFEDPEICYYDLITFRRLYPEFNYLSDKALADHLSSRWPGEKDLNQNDDASTGNSSAKCNAEDLISIGSEPEPILERTGVLRGSVKRGVAPLSIITKPGLNYFVKLVAPPDRIIMTMFIRGGDTLHTKVPLGTFEIRYAAGRKWYGEDCRFGNETAYSKADRSFQFTSNDQGYSGYTVELIMQTSGNLPVSAISRDQF
jgi:hypothetical protein